MTDALPFQKSILCLVLIGVALFAREIWQSVIDGILALGTVEERYRALTIKTAFADQMFYYICTIIAYAALAVAMGSMQAGPTEANQSRADDKPQLAASEPSWRRTSMRAHSQDPIYNGPGVVRDV